MSGKLSTCQEEVSCLRPDDGAFLTRCQRFQKSLKKRKKYQSESLSGTLSIKQNKSTLITVEALYDSITFGNDQITTKER